MEGLSERQYAARIGLSRGGGGASYGMLLA